MRLPPEWRDKMQLSLAISGAINAIMLVIFGWLLVTRRLGTKKRHIVNYVQSVRSVIVDRTSQIGFLLDYLEREHSLLIGYYTAQKILEALLRNSSSENPIILARGRDLKTGLPSKRELSRNDLLLAQAIHLAWKPKSYGHNYNELYKLYRR